MADVRGCNIPEDLHYWPEKHIWVRPQEDGTVLVGVTDVAQNLAKTILNATPKGVGRTVKKGRSLGTIESSKWVGPVTSPVTGEVIESNELLATEPTAVNRDPYGDGWFARIRPDDWGADAAGLLTGDAALEEYGRVLEAEGIECGD